MALAWAMRLSVAEVFEDASFYHHVENLRDGASALGHTLRVCDGLSCQDASISGLGQAAPNPLRCVIEFFPHEIGLRQPEMAP